MTFKLKKHSEWLILVAIIVLGTFLRFYRIEENLVFHGELGHNYLAIKNFILNRDIPLIGPPTSHPWLSFGSLFYWIFAPILLAFKFNPIAGSYFFAFIGSVTIFINFLVVRALFNKRVGLISSLLIAVSPLWVSLARGSRFYSLTSLFFYPFLYFLVKNNFFLSGIFLGLMFNFHLSPIILIPPTILFLILTSRRMVWSEAAYGLTGFLIPNIPFVIYNGKSHFTMLTNLVIWIPYRILGFAWLYPKNHANLSVLTGDISSFYTFVTTSFFVDGKIVMILVFWVFVATTFLVSKKAFGNKIKSKILAALILFFVLGTLGIFVHGDPPSHYYLPLYPIPLLLLSVWLSKLLDAQRIRYFVVAFLIFAVLANLRFYFSKRWFYIPNDRITEGVVPYSMQLDIAKIIISDTHGERFSITRVGPSDYFEGNFAQNYHYLLWWMGNEPVASTSLLYTIYEDRALVPINLENQTWKVGDIILTKETNNSRQ